MNIAFFSDNLYPEVSGISDSILLLGKQLIKDGHNVAYIGPTYSKKNYASVNAPLEANREDFKGMKFFRLPSFKVPFSPTNQAQFVIPYGKSISFLKEFKVDVIHTQLPFGVGLEALIASRYLKVPLVGTNHTLFEGITETLPLQQKWFKNIAYKIISSYFCWYYNKCSFVSSPAQSLLDTMKASGLHSEQQKISNPVSLQEFTIGTEEEKINAQDYFLNKHKIKNSTLKNIFVLYSGRLAPEKRVNEVIDAVFKAQEKLNDLQLTFLIAGNGIDESKLKKQIENLRKNSGVGKVSPNIIFCGYLHKDEMVLANKASDMFSIMSITETQCLSAMQAFSSGLPVLACSLHGLKEYIPLEAGYLINSGDTNVLSEKIVELANNPILSKKLGQFGHTYVQNFNPPVIAQFWEAVYNEAKF